MTPTRTWVSFSNKMRNERLDFIFKLQGLHMLAFLIEVLEKGMQQVQVPVLNVLHCMLHYIDLSSSQAQPISGDLLRVIAKYLDVSQLTVTLTNHLIKMFIAEFLLERSSQNTEISCDTKLQFTSCPARI